MADSPTNDGLQNGRDDDEIDNSDASGDSGDQAAAAMRTRIARAVARSVAHRHRVKRDGGAHPRPSEAADPALVYLDELSQTAIGREWLEYDPFERPRAAQLSREPGVIAPLPRRKLLEAAPAGEATPPMAKKVKLEAGLLPTLSRYFLWHFGLVRFLLTILFDLATGRSSAQRRAERARHAIERLGPTFVKVGQQLSVRADLLPYVYCQEFAKMLSHVRPISSDVAIAAVERTMGKKLGEVFAIFDPQPVGSGSLACVYQAVLHIGDRVAVKVRRPGITAMIAADLRVSGWMFEVGEFIGVLRPGSTKNLLADVRSMYTDEVNFSLEARNTELFRRECETLTQPYASAQA